MDVLIAIICSNELIRNQCRGALVQLCARHAVLYDYEDQHHDGRGVFTIHDYDRTGLDFSAKLGDKLGHFLIAAIGDLSIETQTMRTMGFGEDRPRWEHNGRGGFTCNVPGEI